MSADEVRLDAAMDRLETTVLRIKSDRDLLLDVLNEALEFIEDQEDVLDGDYGVPQANRAMQLASELRRVVLRVTR